MSWCSPAQSLLMLDLLDDSMTKQVMRSDRVLRQDVLAILERVQKRRRRSGWRRIKAAVCWLAARPALRAFLAVGVVISGLFVLAVA